MQGVVDVAWNMQISVFFRVANDSDEINRLASRYQAICRRTVKKYFNYDGLGRISKIEDKEYLNVGIEAQDSNQMVAAGSVWNFLAHVRHIDPLR